MGVKDSEGVDVADCRWDAPEGVDFSFAEDALLKDGFALAFEPSEEEEDELLEILDLQFGLSAQLLDVVLDDVLGLHVDLVDMVVLQVVAKTRLAVRDVELILLGVLPRGHENDGLVEPTQGLNPLLALEYPLPEGLDASALCL